MNLGLLSIQIRLLLSILSFFHRCFLLGTMFYHLLFGRICYFRHFRVELSGFVQEVFLYLQNWILLQIVSVEW
jgi:hypothetical protein